ncbi:glycosyl hydrolase [Flavobacterium sp. DG1-102-2]|uniref:glycoside hydrolase family 26 protein n=1 Tax=Flavobacterium sp. DG1-102-2 TaxID=3081663 RepID=UPI002948E6D9|nr:glycosyl hydrolase [Flavobacterium sp. DG1-102-2]MDV6166896.1 glycosyl hydrolase [Flavobacterium sp. DG1-102-2]
MKNKIAVMLAISLTISCKSTSQVAGSPIDKKATKETVALYKNLFKAKEKGYMFGHQDALAYGVEWKYEEGRSDIKDVTGDYPAVYGWDLGGIENKAEKQIDGIPFDKQTDFVRQVYDRGGVNTFSWHSDNPLSGKNAWDNPEGTVASILPGGAHHEKFKGWMDNAAQYLLTLKGSDGKLVPVLYRPFHEFTGNWFWWCKNTTTPEQFKALWKFTVEYFESKGVHNLIYVYNTSDSNVQTEADFMEYYPGDEWVDIVSFDIYQGGSGEKQVKFVNDTKRLVAIIDKVAKDHNKLAAIAETGYEAVPDSKWWTGTLTEAIGDKKISYVLLWRNHGWNEGMTPPRMHYYAPYKGQQSADDFVKFYNKGNTLFQKEVTKLKLYK